MKKIDFYESDGLYLARSLASANSLFFENKNDHELFFGLFDKYLGGMLEIAHYTIIPTAWILIFRTKSAESISACYHLQRSQSKKAKSACTHEEIGKMLSEHFRIFLAQYVRKSNACNMRHGSKVHSRFEKFAFESEADLQTEIQKIETLQSFNDQWLEKYFANLGYYDVDQEIKMDPELQSAKGFYLGKKLKSKYLNCFRSFLVQLDVVRKLISSTLQTHFGQNPPFPNLNSS